MATETAPSALIRFRRIEICFSAEERTPCAERVENQHQLSFRNSNINTYQVPPTLDFEAHSSQVGEIKQCQRQMDLPAVAEQQ